MKSVLKVSLAVLFVAGIAFIASSALKSQNGDLAVNAKPQTILVADRGEGGF